MQQNQPSGNIGIARLMEQINRLMRCPLQVVTEIIIFAIIND